MRRATVVLLLGLAAVPRIGWSQRSTGTDRESRSDRSSGSTPSRRAIRASPPRRSTRTVSSPSGRATARMVPGGACSGAPRAAPSSRVNTFATGDQHDPDVASNGSGDFVVVWTSPQDGSGDGVFGATLRELGRARGPGVPGQHLHDRHPVPACGGRRPLGRLRGRLEQPGPGGGRRRGLRPTVQLVRCPSRLGVQGQHLHHRRPVPPGHGLRLRRQLPGGLAGRRRAGQRGPRAAGSSGGATTARAPRWAPSSRSTRTRPASRARRRWPSIRPAAPWSCGTATGRTDRTSGSSASATPFPGTPIASEFQVNTFTTGRQADPAVGMEFTGNGCFVVAWSSDGEDGSGSGVFGRVYLLRRRPARRVPLQRVHHRQPDAGIGRGAPGVRSRRPLGQRGPGRFRHQLSTAGSTTTSSPSS